MGGRQDYSWQLVFLWPSGCSFSWSIAPFRGVRPSGLVAFGEADTGHALAEAAMFHEGPFEMADLLVQQVVCHLD
jgi:hypothetical protein